MPRKAKKKTPPRPERPPRNPLRKRLAKAALRCVVGRSARSGFNFDHDVEEPGTSENLDETFTEAQRKRMPRKREKPLEDSFVQGSPIGAGNFGRVDKLKHKTNDEWMASKLITDFSTEKHIQSAEREIEILKMLDHPNIIKYFDSFRMKGKKVYVNMELCATDLDKFLKLFLFRMDIMYIKFILQSILRGCEHMHSRNVVHRDLKPANILITHGGVIKITDFGLSRVIEPPAAGRVRHYSGAGTAHYCAPEVLEGSHDYGWEVDIWAVGCLAHDLYFNGEMLNHDCRSVRDILENIRLYCGPIPGSLPELLMRVLNNTGGSNDDATLFSALLNLNHRERPNATDVLRLRYFHRGAVATPAELANLYRERTNGGGTEV